MKYLMSGAALATIWSALSASPVWAQVQADYDVEIQREYEDLWAETAETDEILMLHPRPFKGDQVIVSGTRIGTDNAGTLTAPVSILTVSEIAARGSQYVSDLLRALPGVAVSQSGAGGGVTQIRVRGAEANHVLVLVDGVEVANPSTGEFDLSGLRAQDIVKIEFLRGEQSALYGSDAIGGVISIITRAGETGEQYRVSIEAGSRGTIEGQASAIIPIGEAALSINGNAFRTDGFDVSGLNGERDGSRSRALNLGLNAVKLGPVRLDAKFGKSRLNVDFDEDAPFNGRLDNTNSETTVKTQTARLDARFETGAVNHKLSGSYLETNTDTRAGFSTRSIGERLQTSWVAGYESKRHDLTALAEYERETYRIDPNFTEAGAEPKNEMGAIALDYRFTHNALTLSASGRHDINDLFADATTWRLGAGYNFDWEGRLRGSVGTGVKNPSLIELFGFFPGSNFTGNADLKPETSLGYSVGYEQSFDNIFVSVDLFRSELDDEIVTRFLPPTFAATVVNLTRESTRQGVEIEAAYDTGDFRLSGSATFLDSEEDGSEEIRRPDFTGSISVDWQATDALRLSAQLDHTGSQLDTDFATSTNVELDAFTLLGARAAYSLGDVTLTLRGDNLLNEDYQQIVSFASPGRGVFAGVSLDF